MESIPWRIRFIKCIYLASKVTPVYLQNISVSPFLTKARKLIKYEGDDPQALMYNKPI